MDAFIIYGFGFGLLTAMWLMVIWGAFETIRYIIKELKK